MRQDTWAHEQLENADLVHADALTLACYVNQQHIDQSGVLLGIVDRLHRLQHHAPRHKLDQLDIVTQEFRNHGLASHTGANVILEEVQMLEKQPLVDRVAVHEITQEIVVQTAEAPRERVGQLAPHADRFTQTQRDINSAQITQHRLHACLDGVSVATAQP